MTAEQIKQVFRNLDPASLEKVLHTQGIIEVLTVKDLKDVLVEQFKKDLMSQANNVHLDEGRLERIIASDRFEQLLLKLFFEMREMYEMSMSKISVEPLEELIEEILTDDEMNLTTPFREISKSFIELSETPFMKTQEYEVTYQVTPGVGLVTKVKATFEIKMSIEEILSQAKVQFDAMPVSKNSIYMYDKDLFSVRELTMIPDGEVNA